MSASPCYRHHDPMAEETTHATASRPATTIRGDLMALTKARLSFLVVVTTAVGFVLASRGADLDWWRLFHTLLGTSMAAFGSSVFNQLMEIDADARMERTRERPLPGRRMAPGLAFGIGWLLSAFALIHLSRLVNVGAALLTALTLAVDIFVYTPLKQRSSSNTLVGAVAGAIPPVIGWVAAAGPTPDGRFFRGELLAEPGAAFLFLLLFFWQLPHFVAINWMYRDQYINGGFVMWSNDDATGRRTATLAIAFSLGLSATMLLPYLRGAAGLPFLATSLAFSLAMVALAARFFKTRDRQSARTLFFYTLAYLPILLLITLLTWNTTK
ncbi:heme o synthase [soil metagenome]